MVLVLGKNISNIEAKIMQNFSHAIYFVLNLRIKG